MKARNIGKNNCSNDELFSTGYKQFDEPYFGKCPIKRLSTQPDYKVAVIWPLYNYALDFGIDAAKKEMDILLKNYFDKKCIDGTNCIYYLEGYLELYLSKDGNKKEVFQLVDKKRGFIPLYFYDKSTRIFNNKQNKPRFCALYKCMDDLKKHKNELFNAFCSCDNWNDIQNDLPKILNYGT